jgi:hypothetical protein
MKVCKIGNEKTVHLIPGGDIQANASAVQSISTFLPPDKKAGSIKGDRHVFTSLCARQNASQFLHFTLFISLACAVSYDTAPINGYKVISLSWPSKSFIESDTTQSAVDARQEMFPDGGIYANVPSVGNCLISLSQEEMNELSNSTAKSSIRSGLLPSTRCEQVLTQLLLSLSRVNLGFRGLPIDVFFNEDENSDNSASPLVYTGWPNVARLQMLAQHQTNALHGMETMSNVASTQLQPPYQPNHCGDFNIPPENGNYHDERAALQVCICSMRRSRLGSSIEVVNVFLL